MIVRSMMKWDKRTPVTLRSRHDQNLKEAARAVSRL